MHFSDTDHASTSLYSNTGMKMFYICHNCQWNFADGLFVKQAWIGFAITWGQYQLVLRLSCDRHLTVMILCDWSTCQNSTLQNENFRMLFVQNNIKFYQIVRKRAKNFGGTKRIYVFHNFYQHLRVISGCPPEGTTQLQEKRLWPMVYCSINMISQDGETWRDPMFSILMHASHWVQEAYQ